MRRTILLIFLIVVVTVLVLGFALLNKNTVEIDYFFGQHEFSVSIWVLGAFFVGVVFGLCLLVFDNLRLRLELRRQKNRTNSIDKELVELRTLPVKDAY